MIYTTYLSNLKNLPEENSVKFLITRWKPRNTIDVKKYNLEWRPNLAPTELTLAKYKDESITWSEYRQLFIDESFENQLFIDGLQEAMNYNDEGLDVFLICYEKDDSICHRSILQEIFEINGYQCKEYRKD
jgi:uncharacterized protein YeaO (DUF488 family)